MNVLLNDKLTDLPDNILTVKDLVVWKNIPMNGTAIALNDKLIKQNDWESAVLKENDQLTIISAAYGG